MLAVLPLIDGPPVQSEHSAKNSLTNRPRTSDPEAPGARPVQLSLASNWQ
jgi:hypothetical protein